MQLLIASFEREDEWHIDLRNSLSITPRPVWAESNFCRGFSIDAPPDALTTYSTTSEAQQWGIIVEEDSVVGIMGQE